MLSPSTTIMAEAVAKVVVKAAFVVGAVDVVYVELVAQPRVLTDFKISHTIIYLDLHLILD